MPIIHVMIITNGGCCMKKTALIAIALLLCAGPLFAQDKKAPDAKKDDKSATDTKEAKDVDRGGYAEMVLEDFETTSYTDKSISFRVTKDQKAGVAVRDQFPAPTPGSKKYLGVKFYSKRGDVLTIYPAKKLIIEKYCRSLSVWVYGKNFSGELSMLLRDGTGQNHRLVFGKLNFQGWKKMSVKITDRIPQEDKYLSQKRFLEITQIIYAPGNTTSLPIWNYFYLDDISASVREKYIDKQSDEW